MIDTFDKHGGSATEANERKGRAPQTDETGRQVEESPATKRKKCWKL